MGVRFSFFAGRALRIMTVVAATWAPGCSSSDDSTADDRTRSRSEQPSGGPSSSGSTSPDGGATERACTDLCGDGTQRFEDGAWQPCEVPVVERRCRNVCGEGRKLCRGGAWGPCDAGEPLPPKFFAVVRDFHETHPDMEIGVGGDEFDPGIVASEIGEDDKPVYAAATTTRTTSGKESFDQWYRDVPDVNEPMVLQIALVRDDEDPDLFILAGANFFPIDDQLFGNEGLPHNYHFTLEAHAEFDYVGGEVFEFHGDDDMWVFINGRRAIDLGGIHRTMTARVDLDAERERLAIQPGNRYPVDFFFAERHTVQSNLTIRTSLALKETCSRDAG